MGTGQHILRSTKPLPNLLSVPTRRTTIPTMSIVTLSDLTYLTPQDLASLLSSPTTACKLTAIDVRDDDHIGGHIKGSLWVPVQQLDARIPELIRVRRGKEKVVFHCMLSQQMGPSSALKFLRRLRLKQEKEGKEGDEGKGLGEGKYEPTVAVLNGGFGAWQARYGENESLIEGYVKELWD